MIKTDITTPLCRGPACRAPLGLRRLRLLRRRCAQHGESARRYSRAGPVSSARPASLTWQIPPDAESLRLVLIEALSTFRQQLGRLTQAIGFIVTADSVLLAYGFSQKESGILLIGSLMPILALLIYIQFLYSSTPVVYVAIAIEQKLRLDDVPLMGTYARKGFKPIFSIVARSDNASDGTVRDSVLALSYHNWIVRPISLVLSCIFLAQLGLFFIGMISYRYRFM